MMNVELIKNELKSQVTDFVKTEAKEATVVWLNANALPAAKEVASAYISALKESAAEEKGWCRFRDAVFLPLVVDFGLWFLDNSLSKMAGNH